MFEENNFDINNGQTEQNKAQTEVPVEPINFYDMLPKSYLQKRDIRRLAAVIGISALSISAISYFWYDVYLFFAIRIFGMSQVATQKLLFDPAVQQIVQIILSMIIFLLPFTIAVSCAREKLGNIMSFKKPKSKTFWPFVLFGVGFCAFANIAVSLASDFLRGITDEQYNVPSNPNPDGIYGFLLTFIATAIVPALVEEFACRGVILGLLRKHGDGFAVITSAIVFGVIHGNFEQMPFAFFVGLILGYIYIKTESMWTCIVVHSVNNAVSVIFVYAQTHISGEVQGIAYTVYLAIALLVAVISVLFLSKNKEENYSLNNGDGAVKESHKYLCFFTSWAILLFLAANFYEAISYFNF